MMVRWSAAVGVRREVEWGCDVEGEGGEHLAKNAMQNLHVYKSDE